MISSVSTVWLVLSLWYADLIASLNVNVALFTPAFNTVTAKSSVNEPATPPIKFNSPISMFPFAVVALITSLIAPPVISTSIDKLPSPLNVPTLIESATPSLISNTPLFNDKVPTTPAFSPTVNIPSTFVTPLPPIVLSNVPLNKIVDSFVTLSPNALAFVVNVPLWTSNA